MSINQNNEELNEILNIVNNLPSSSGGVPQGYVTPQMFGAVGDGITDDTEAFDAAIATGMPIFLSKKTYKVTGFVFDKDVDIRGNGCTILASGKAYSDTSGSFAFSCNSSCNIKISGINIIPLNHVVALMRYNYATSVLIDNCNLDGCAIDNNDMYTNDGANQGIRIENCLDVKIINCCVYNMYGFGISFADTINILVTGCKTDRTGRGGIYILGNNKNVTIDNNIITNAVKNFTVSDGALDVYGAWNTEIRLINNYIEGFGCETAKACGIRIKGSANVICEKNTIKTTNDSYFIYGIMLQERYEQLDADCIIRDNFVYINELPETETTMGHMIRIMDDCITKNLMILNNTLETSREDMGISFRRDMEDVLVQGNTIKTNGTAIEAYPEEGYVRNNLQIYNNIIHGRVSISYCHSTFILNNIIIYEVSSPMTVANSAIVYIDGNKIKSDYDITITDCIDCFIGDNNIYEKTTAVIRSKQDAFIKEVDGQTVIIPEMSIVPNIKYYGESIADESATVDNMIEYTVFNADGNLTLSIGEQTLTDSVPKYAIRTKQVGLANYIDENGDMYISDYRDWANGVDWHYIREITITGEEKLYPNIFPRIGYALHTNWLDGKPYVGINSENTPEYNRYKTPFVSNFYYQFSSPNSTVNLPIFITNNLIRLYPQDQNSNIRQFETEEEWYNFCKNKYNNGTPLKFLYALYEPYTTPIPEEELAAYKTIIASGLDTEITSSANKKFDVIYFINDMYTRGVKQLIAAALNALPTWSGGVY